MSNTATYTIGFTIKSLIPITKNDYITICEELSEELGLDVFPQHVTEGGMQIKTKEGYKCMRHPTQIKYNDLKKSFTKEKKMFRAQLKALKTKNDPHVENPVYPIEPRMYEDQDIEWPSIYGNEKNTWRQSNEVLFPENTTSRTWLKSFYGAPLWTMKEIHVFKSAFERHGFKVYKIPKAHELITFSERLSCRKYVK